METFLRAGLGNALLATILAVGAAGAGCFFRRRPAVRHALWLLVLLKLVTPPLWVVPLAGPGPTSPSEPEPGSNVAERDRDVTIINPSPAAAIPPEWVAPQPAVTSLAGSSPIGFAPHQILGSAAWIRGATAIWITGSLLTLAVTGLRIRRWNRLLRFVEPASDEVQDQVDDLAQQMGITRPPTSWWFPGPSAPMLWALGCQARLIVPSELWGRLDDRQRITLLVHELAHLRRKDHWVRVVELLATALYWWLPLAWIARRALREAEEQCCDAWVVWTCPDALRAYAETLLDTVDFLSETGRAAPLAASGFGQAHHLKRRVTMIMQGKTPRGLGWTGLLTMLGLSALLLPLSPTWAQKTDDDPAEVKERRFIVEAREESKDSDLADLKQELTNQLRKLQSLEKQFAEKAITIKAGAGASKEPGKPSENATTLKRNVIVELRDPDAKGPLILKSHPTLFQAKEVRLFDQEHKVILNKELARAKAEVDRARAQLHRAEEHLARLGEEFRAKQEKAKIEVFERKIAEDREHRVEPSERLRLKLEREKDKAKDKPKDKDKDEAKEESKDKGRAEGRDEGRKTRTEEFVIGRNDVRIQRLQGDIHRLLEKKLAQVSPEKDQRIADLEKKLEELVQEVKNLKSERPDSKK